jgi:hypothetical protein
LVALLMKQLLLVFLKITVSSTLYFKVMNDPLQLMRNCHAAH